MNNDEYFYNKALDCILNSKLDQAWIFIQKIKSDTIKNKIINQCTNRIDDDIKDNIYYDWITYKGCDGQYHTYDNTPEYTPPPKRPDNNGGNVCLSIIISSLCCFGYSWCSGFKACLCCDLWYFIGDACNFAGSIIGICAMNH